MDINTLRKMRNQDFGKISSEFEKIANPQSDSKSYQDDRFWKLEADKAGNGTATIRFLPRADGDELPWVKIFTHGFQGPTGKWYIENSLTTIGENDPVGELNSRLWNTGSDSDKEVARKQKRKLSYYANVLIISDPKHPENEGKVKLFKFGKKIFDKIMDKARPTFEDETPVNVFDFWEGADFKLRMRKVDGYPNYDQSAFQEPAAISEDEDQILAIANSQHKLAEFLDKKNFKTYEELARKLASVLEGSSGNTPSAASIAEDDEQPRQRVVQAATKAKVSIASSDDSDEEALSYFKKIAMEE
jgi:dihydroneopterin aldolase